MIIINVLLKTIIPLLLFIVSFKHFTFAAYAYSGYLVLFALYILALESNRPQPDPQMWNDFEIHVIRRYHVALKYPRTANDIACQINGHQMAAWIWIPWFLYHRFWAGPVVMLLFHFIIGRKQIVLAPFWHLPQAAAQGCPGADDELQTLEEIRNR